MQFLDQRFTGERALFKTFDAQIDSCIFADGESPLKESKRLDISRASFQWRYPLWYCEDVKVVDSYLFEDARAPVWYTDRSSFENVLCDAPKGFRRCNNLSLKNVTFSNGIETLWHCKKVRLENVNARGEYFAMNSEEMEIDNLSLVGKYAFDGVKNVIITNSKLITKDVFWNTENIIVKDSYICGQYIGWNSKNITFINCTIESEQGLCYIDGLNLQNCKLLNTDLAFEYVKDIEAEITTDILSIKNPINGSIKAKSIGEVIFDDKDIDSNKTQIELLD